MKDPDGYKQFIEGLEESARKAREREALRERIRARIVAKVGERMVQQVEHEVRSLTNDPCTDNYRWALVGDEESTKLYEEQKSEGCCGRIDKEITIGWLFKRRFLVGCNYGH